MVAVGLVAGLGLLGCSFEADEEPRQTIDVPPALEVDISSDVRARQQGPVLVGILPEDFPRDLPLYLPASLIDFAATDDGRQSVTLLTSHSRQRTREGLASLLRQNGWQGSVSGERQRLVKGGREVVLRVEDARPGTLYAYEYGS